MMEVTDESNSFVKLPSVTFGPSDEQVVVLVSSLSENKETSTSLNPEDNESNTKDFPRMSQCPDFECDSVSSIDSELDTGSEYAFDDGDSDVATVLMGSKRARSENLGVSNSSKKRATDKKSRKARSNTKAATKLKKYAKQLAQESLMRERKEQLQGTAADSLTSGKTVIETAAGTHGHEVSALTHAYTIPSLRNIVDGLPSEQRESGIVDQKILLQATRAFGKSSVAPDVETGRWRLKNFKSTLTHYQVLGKEPSPKKLGFN
jgi:hypothetical protein